MFSLWYSLLSWREYKDAIWDKLAPKRQTEQKPAEGTNITPVVPTPKVEPSRIPIVDNTNRVPSPTPPKLLPQGPPKTIPTPQSTNIKPSSPELVTPSPKTLEPPPKPPRSPSPHPMRSEAFDDIEFDSEESEEEEDEENSVIDSTIIHNPVAPNVKEFLSGEINNIENNS